MLCVYVQAQRHAMWAAEEARVQQRARDRGMLREARKQEELQRIRDMEESKKKEEERWVRRELYLSSPSKDRVKLSPLKSRTSPTLSKCRCHNHADDTPVIPWDNSPAAFRLCTAAASNIFAVSPMRLPSRSHPMQGAQQVREMEARMLRQTMVAMKIISTRVHRHEISAQGEFQDEKQGTEQRPQTKETPAARGHLHLREMEQTHAASAWHRSKRTQLRVLDESEAPTSSESLHSEKTDMLWKNRVKTPELPAGAL